MTPAKLTEHAAFLTEAQQDMRRIQSEADALIWMDKHYYPNIGFEVLHDELQAMHRAIVERLAGRA